MIRWCIGHPIGSEVKIWINAASSRVQEKVQCQVHHVSDPFLVQNPFEVYVPVLVGIFSLSEMMKEDVKGLQVVEVVSDGVGQA